MSSNGLSKICNRERRWLPASLLLPYHLPIELDSKAAEKKSFESYCASSLKSEICLIISLRSTGSRAPSALRSWSQSLSSLPVKTMTADEFDLKVSAVSLHGIGPLFCWQSFGPTDVSSRPISWSRFAYFNPLVMFSSCVDVMYGLGFMSTITSTFLLWFCFQWILLRLKKSSQVIPEEPIILTTLMLFVLTTLRRCQSQTNFVHSPVWGTNSMKGFVSYQRDSDMCFRASKHILADFARLLASNSSAK